MPNRHVHLAFMPLVTSPGDADAGTFELVVFLGQARGLWKEDPVSHWGCPKVCDM